MILLLVDFELQDSQYSGNCGPTRLKWNHFRQANTVEMNKIVQAQRCFLVNVSVSLIMRNQ